MFFVGDNNICRSNHFAHHRFRFLTPLPKVSSVIQIARYRQAALACLTHRLECQFRGRCADGGRDATDMEPCASLECALQLMMPGVASAIALCSRSYTTRDAR